MRALMHFLGVMVGGLFLVLLDAAVELVGERVDGGIHVGLGRVGVDLVPAKHQRRLGLVTQLLHREDAVNVDQLLEMPGDSLEFLQDVAAKRRRNFHMMTAEIELHESSYAELTVTCSTTRGQRRACVRWTERSACPRDIWQPCAWRPVCPLGTESPRACVAPRVFRIFLGNQFA